MTQLPKRSGGMHHHRLAPEWLDDLLQTCSDRVLLLHPDGWRIEFANHAACRSLGAEPSALQGRSISDLLRSRTNANLVASLDAAWMAEMPSSVAALSLQSQTDRTEIWQIRYCRVLRDGQTLLGIFAPGNAIQKDAVAGHERRDPLTGLADRTCLLRQLETLLGGERGVDRNFALLFIDLDDFKTINDRWGHIVGDEALRSVADRLSHCLRSGDLLARFGGDEFVAVVYLAETSEEFAPVVERIVKAFSEPLNLPNGETASVAVSVGVAGPPHTATAPQELLDRADRDMYRRKLLSKQPSTTIKLSTPQS